MIIEQSDNKKKKGLNTDNRGSLLMVWEPSYAMKVKSFVNLRQKTS